MTRSGRRPGDSGTRDAVLAAASAAFTEQGFREATVRAIATRAGVDPALVLYFFGSKESLFAAAMALPLDPAEVVPRLLAPGVDGLGERIVLTLLTTLDEAGPGNALIALIRSAATHDTAARMLREFLVGAVIEPVAAALDGDRAPLRVALCASQIVGLVLARHIVALPPLAATDRAVLAAACGPALQHYLVDPLDDPPLPAPGRAGR